MLSQSNADDQFAGFIHSKEMLHSVLKFIPYNHHTLTAMRCVSRPFRSAVQSATGPWADHKEMMISRFGQCLLFNAQEDEKGKSNFQLYSISPVGRKFHTFSASVLGRYHALVANGLTKLSLHYALVDQSFFDYLRVLDNLKEIELVSCRNLTSIGDATKVKNLEKLEVAFCALESDGVRGLRLPHLKSLTIRACHRLSNLNSIEAETAASLVSVHVESCNVYDDTTNVFFSHFSTKLESLCLSNTQVDTAITLIPEEVRRGMKTLQMAGTQLRMETLQDVAPSLQSLEFLSVENCEEFSSFEPIGLLSNLRFLDVSGSYPADDLDGLERCERLELFRMADLQVHKISFVMSLQHLRVLDAPDSAITDEYLLSVENLPLLDTVVLTQCVDITDVNVLRTCPSLVRAFLAKTSVNDEGIALLVECPQLEELDLKMTGVSDVNFLVGCLRLKTINVCSAVSSADGIQALLDKPGVDVLCDSFDMDEDMMNMS